MRSTRSGVGGMTGSPSLQPFAHKSSYTASGSSSTSMPWPFVAAAYAMTIVAVAGLIWWAYASMRRAEAAANKLRK